MLPRPPRPPLFPYTTLFRSIMGVAEGRISALDRVRTRRKALPRLVELFHQDEPVERVAVMHAEAPEEAQQLRADRKSTRLNSSHVSISYAVFCLKKKKRTYT